MASTWAATANNETISFTNLQNAVDTGVFSQKNIIPVSNEQITKDEANIYVNIDTSFNSYASKAGNQLVVKSNLRCTVPVINTQNLIWRGIANNETTASPIQLLSGRTDQGGGRVFRSTDYGVNYSSVLVISDGLHEIKFMPAFRHASFLTVPPFLSVGANGRIVTNSVVNASTWVTVSSPTTQTLHDIAFNAQVGVIVGDARILRTTTNNRINAWAIANGNANIWRAVTTNGSIFVAVGDNNSIITGNSTGTTWTARSMPPLSPSGINLYGVTFHSDSYFYAVGGTSASASYIMRSLDGITWELYTPGGDNLVGILFSVISIGGRLVIGGRDTQHQIVNNVVTTCGASTGGVSIDWVASVKDANSTTGVDMAGDPASVFGTIGAYSNF
jgi:hypothetical protein